MEANINPALTQSAQDVPPDSSSGQGGQPTGEPQSASTPAPDAGQGASSGQSGDADSGQSKEPRTPDNVRGELLRKMDQRDQQLAERLARLEGMMQQAAQAAPPAKPETSAQPTRVEDMTSQQLEALRPQVPEDKRPELDRLIQQRRVDEQVAMRVDARLADQSRQQMRIEANKTAYGRWPELRDPGSQLYQVTNQVLNERGSTVNNDPRALLDAANEAGMRLGLHAKSVERVYGAVDVPSGSAPVNTGGSSRMSKDEAAQIAQRLQNALPGGKKFNLDRAAELHNQYVENKDLYIK